MAPAWDRSRSGRLPLPASATTSSAAQTVRPRSSTHLEPDKIIVTPSWSIRLTETRGGFACKGADCNPDARGRLQANSRRTFERAGLACGCCERNEGVGDARPIGPRRHRRVPARAPARSSLPVAEIEAFAGHSLSALLLRRAREDIADRRVVDTEGLIFARGRQAPAVSAPRHG
jgi:hypothetical protein